MNVDERPRSKQIQQQPKKRQRKEEGRLKETIATLASITEQRPRKNPKTSGKQSSVVITPEKLISIAKPRVVKSEALWSLRGPVC